MELSAPCKEMLARYIEPVRSLIETYLTKNAAARRFIEQKYGDEIYIDHITPRTRLDFRYKSFPFTHVGYEHVRTYAYKNEWIAEVYAFQNYLRSPLAYHAQPVIFMDRALPHLGEPDPSHTISQWIGEFPEKALDDYLLHHIACRVKSRDDFMRIKKEMENDEISFGDNVPQEGCEGKLVQIFTKAEMLPGAKSKKLVPGTVFELVYRDPSLSDDAFIEDQANSLMAQSKN
jgi:hypothetical protein